MLTEIKKGKGIEGLVKGHDIQKLEEEKKIEVSSVPHAKKLIERVSRLLDYFERYYSVYDLERNQERFRNLEDHTTEVFSSSELRWIPDLIHMETVQYSGVRCYGELLTRVIKKLVRTSYESGNNDFNLSVSHFHKNSEISFLGSFEADKDNPLRVNFRTDAQASIGHYMKNGIVNISGMNPLGSIGFGVSNCNFTIDADCGDLLGAQAYDSDFVVLGDVHIMSHPTRCKFDIKGETEYFPHGAKDSEFIFRGGVNGIGINSEGCTFKIFDEKSLEQMKNMTDYHKEKGLSFKNKIIFINGNSEEVIADYGG